MAEWDYVVATLLAACALSPVLVQFPPSTWVYFLLFVLVKILIAFVLTDEGVTLLSRVVRGIGEMTPNLPSPSPRACPRRP